MHLVNWLKRCLLRIKPRKTAHIRHPCGFVPPSSMLIAHPDYDPSTGEFLIDPSYKVVDFDGKTAYEGPDKEEAERIWDNLFMDKEA